MSFKWIIKCRNRINIIETTSDFKGYREFKELQYFILYHFLLNFIKKDFV